MDKRKVIYYSDELHDEFSTFQTTPPKVDASYDYERKSPVKRFFRFFLYRIVMYPVVVFYGRVVFRQRIDIVEELDHVAGQQRVDDRTEADPFLHGDIEQQDEYGT